MILELPTHNIKQIIESWPPNSPICLPLVFRLSRGMMTRMAGGVFGISHTMVGRIRHLSPKDNWHFNLQCAPAVTRDQWNAQAVDLFYKVMDEMMPYVLGGSSGNKLPATDISNQVHLLWWAVAKAAPMGLTYFQTRGELTHDRG